MHLGVVLARLSQNVHHFADGVLGVLGPLHDAHHGLIAGFSFFKVRTRDKDVARQRSVLRQQVCVVLAHLQRAHELLVRAFQNFCHGRLAHMVAPPRHHCHAHRVAVHRMHTVTLGHQYRFAAVGRLESILSIGFATEGSFHHLRREVQRIKAVLAILLDVIVHEKRLQDVDTHHFCRMCLQMELLEDALQIKPTRRIFLEKLDKHRFEFFFPKVAATAFLFSHSIIFIVCDGQETADDRLRPLRPNH